jgi:acyl-CoA synthetase (AMP-forming)/AMP-acid ligase II
VLALAKHPLVDRYDLSALRVITCAAAPLGEDLAHACMARLDCLLKQGYGMTEASPATHFMPDVGSKPGSIGPAMPGTECLLVDPASGLAVGPGERGELWVRGPQVMKGYLNQPAATARTVDRDGWLHTGDVAYADGDGCFYIVDRVKELIKYKGYQVAPAELEALLVSHPAVADAAVIGVPDEEAGEVPKAFVVPRVEVAQADLLAWVAERVSPYKKIRQLELVDRIPKSPSGKILRRLLAERERAGAPG